MTWRYPADDRHVPAGGGFLSTVLDNGQRRSLPHSGLDYSHWEGSPVYVIGPGTAVARGSNDSAGWGNYVYVDHGNIGDGRHLYSYYAHMQNDPPGNGTRFNGGEQIGVIGRSGSGITGAHLHWGTALCTPSQFGSTVVPMGSAARALLVNPEAEVAKRSELAPHQRMVKPNLPALRRAEPTRASAELQPPLAPNEIGNFNGWIHGERVNMNGSDTDIWFRGISGNWFWSGGFTSQATTGLEDLNPKPPADPKVRMIRTDIVNARARAVPAASGTYVEIPAGATITVLAFRKGEPVNDGVNATHIWFRTKDGYVWAGSTTDPSTAGIPEETSPAPVPTTPKWPSEPFTFTADLDVVSRVVPADWSNFENEWSLPDVIMPDGTVVNPRKGFPALPQAIVWHQWGDPTGTPQSQRDSVLREATTRHEDPNARKSWHFVVTEDEIIQQVPLDERAYHGGPGGNGYVGVECDPRMTPAVIANIRRLRAALHAHFQAELQDKLHREFAATSCGSYIAPHLDAIRAPEPEPEPASHTVTFVATGFQQVQEVAHGERATPIPLPELEGYDPIGWDDEAGNPYLFNQPVTSDIQLHAAYEAWPELTEPEPAPTNPQPEIPVEPEDPEEDPMPATPPPPNPPAVPADVILPRSIRGPLLLGSWIVGSAIGAANVGWIYAIEQGVADYPVWLGVATAVFGFASAQINAIARANLNPPPTE